MIFQYFLLHVLHTIILHCYQGTEENTKILHLQLLSKDHSIFMCMKNYWTEEIFISGDIWHGCDQWYFRVIWLLNIQMRLGSSKYCDPHKYAKYSFFPIRQINARTNKVIPCLDPLSKQINWKPNMSHFPISPYLWGKLTHTNAIKLLSNLRHTNKSSFEWHLE